MELDGLIVNLLPESVLVVVTVVVPFFRTILAKPLPAVTLSFRFMIMLADV